MFCIMCQNILNLDVLLGTFEEDENYYDEAKRHLHHESFTALEQSAKDGCEMCRMACSSLSKPRGSKPVEGRIWFQLRPGDFLMFGSDFLGDRGVVEPPSDKFCIRPCADQDSPLTTLRDGVFISRLPIADASSSSAFEMARYWLKTCLSIHSRCSSKESLLPTRVLDLGNRHDTRLSLHWSKGEHGQWLTLSHCWGSSNTAITTTSNFKTRCNDIQIANLPATFRDAVKITRELWYRYLWIDSLCIIQDSVSDWQMESVKMAETYANAVLNIFADASGGADEGIFESANRGEICERWKDSKARPASLYLKPKSLQLFMRSPNHAISTNVRTYSWRPINPDYLSLLQRRAWVLQEAALSQRRLRYTSRGLHWSCSTVMNSYNDCQLYEIHKTSRDADNVVRSIYHIPNDDLQLKEIGGRPSMSRWYWWQWWYSALNDYSVRVLTYSRDRYPGISGLAKEFARRTGYHYKSGIWVEDFCRGLL